MGHRSMAETLGNEGLVSLTQSTPENLRNDNNMPFSKHFGKIHN